MPLQRQEQMLERKEGPRPHNGSEQQGTFSCFLLPPNPAPILPHVAWETEASPQNASVLMTPGHTSWPPSQVLN